MSAVRFSVSGLRRKIPFQVASNASLAYISFDYCERGHACCSRDIPERKS
jgi:hypothetical protein